MYHLLGPGDEIDLSKVRIKKAYKSGNASILDISYGEKNLQIFWQTPECFIPYGYERCGEGVSMDVSVKDGVFMKRLETMMEHIIGKLSRCIPEQLKGKRLISCVRDGTLRLKCANASSILFFDGNNNPITASRDEFIPIKRGDKLILIFQVENVLIYKDFYKVSFKLLQVKKTNIEITKPLFVSSEDAMPEKYKKMLSMGIPMAAVQQRMKLDGLKGPIMPVAAITLKKVIELPLPKPKAVVQQQRAPVPSLAEITSALKKLRPTKQISDNDK